MFCMLVVDPPMATTGGLSLAAATSVDARPTGDIANPPAGVTFVITSPSVVSVRAELSPPNKVVSAPVITDVDNDEALSPNIVVIELEETSPDSIGVNEFSTLSALSLLVI